MDIPSILDIRLRIDDPSGYPDMVSVDSLPSEADEQTAYRLTTNGHYLDSEGNRIQLLLSDARIDALITQYGLDKAECRCYEELRHLFGSKLRITKLTAGADSTEFIKLKELYDYYKRLEEDCKDRIKADTGNNSGIFGLSKQPTIAGGFI